MENRMYSLHVNGLFGRNRKAKRETFEIGDDRNLGTLDDIVKRAKGILKDQKPKDGLQWAVVAYPCEYKDWGGVIIGITEGKKIAIGQVVNGEIVNNEAFQA
jgi:hypothetical protein